jgi:hypothetical protein
MAGMLGLKKIAAKMTVDHLLVALALTYWLVSIYAVEYVSLKRDSGLCCI